MPERTGVPHAPSCTWSTISRAKSSTLRVRLRGSWYSST
jgi:hypothetical protein